MAIMEDDPQMTPQDAPDEPFRPDDDDGQEAEELRLELDGFEGPIDLLLSLAREHKLDLTSISILALAEQYLDYIARARRLNLEIAAGYLVTAAWLAWMKSRLLLPPEETSEDEEEDPALLAARLAFRMQRLDALRRAAAKLIDLPQKNRDFFARGAPEPFATRIHRVPQATLYDLLAAYGGLERRRRDTPLHIAAPRLHSVDVALRRLSRMLGHTPDWRVLQAFLPEEDEDDPLLRRSILASYFSASLELARRGALTIRQGAPFDPIYVRGTPSGGNPPGNDDGKDRRDGPV